MNTPVTRPGRYARIACLFYEALTVIALTIVGLIIPHTLLGVFAGITASGRVLLTHLFLLLLIYFVWQWLNGGQTLAMKTWRIKLQSEEALPLRPAQALLRYAVAWPGTLLAGIGFLWAIADREGRYLHDRIAGTILITENEHDE